MPRFRTSTKIEVKPVKKPTKNISQRPANSPPATRLSPPPSMFDSVDVGCRLFVNSDEVERIKKYAANYSYPDMGIISNIVRDASLPDREPEQFSGRYEIFIVMVH